MSDITQRAVFIIGADGTGKTKTSKALSRLLGLPRFKCPAEKEMFREGSFGENLSFDLFLPHFASQTGLSFISDRGYPCEWVYSQVFDRKTDREKLKRIDDLWADGPGYANIVLLTRSDEELFQVEDDLVDATDLPYIQNGYKEFMLLTSVTFIREFRTKKGGDWDRTAEEIASWLANTRPVPPKKGNMLEQELWKAICECDGPLWRETGRHLRRAYLHIQCGTPKEALCHLIKIDRDILPQEFWEVLGRSW